MTDKTKPKRKRGRPKKNNNTTSISKTKKEKNKSKSKKYSILDTQKNKKQKIVESVLVHLPINIDKFQKKDIFFDNEFLNYDTNIPEEPKPYDPKSTDNNNIYIDTKVKDNVKDEVVENKNIYNIHDKDEYTNKKVKSILVQFNDFNQIKQWPNSIDIKCWWCCHTFETSPCGIPIKYNTKEDIFYVFGCFCSFNCALSYNFETNSEKKWERAGLIQLLHNKTMDNDNEVQYAPHKECLKEFGGYMTIKDFRNVHINTLFNINYPPMLSIIPQLEEIKIIKETNRENDFQQRLNLVSQKVKRKNKKKNEKSLSMFLKKKKQII